MADRLKTALPGPHSAALNTRRQAVVARGQSTAWPVYIKTAKGAILVDVDGNEFIDFAGGIGTMNVGHSHPEVLRAIADQAAGTIHPCFTVTPYEPYVELAERLTKLAPGKSAKKAVFFNSGAEAVENAVKIAKTHTGRIGIIVFENAFHGRTLLTLSLTSKVDPYKKGFGPFVNDVFRLPYPAEGLTVDFDAYGVTHFDPGQIACAVIEPVTGEGGFTPAGRAGMQALRAFCDTHGIVLILDEVQTGFGRTGKFFAVEHFGIEPDLITVAKSLAAGLPLSGVIGKADIMDAPHVGGLGGTYGGNPVSCAAALAVLDIMEKENLPALAAAIGKTVRRELETILPECPWIGSVRGMGAMIGIELVDPKTGKPDKARSGRVAQHAFQNGLITIGAGTYGNVIRTLMPLTIPEDVLREGLEILKEALRHA